MANNILIPRETESIVKNGLALLRLSGFFRNIKSLFDDHRLEVFALTDGATIATDCSEGSVFTLLHEENGTLSNPTDMVLGKTYKWYITQDPTGGWTLDFGTNFDFITSTEIRLGANSVTEIEGVVVSSTSILMAVKGNVDQIGMVTPFGAAIAPNGYLISGPDYNRTTFADLFAVIGTTFGVGDGLTTFGTPDCRGIFVRGAGTHGSLIDAGGTAFSGVLGIEENDKMQGHWHRIRGTSLGSSAYMGDVANKALHASAGYNDQVVDPVTDTVNGTPRIGTETNPAAISLTYIIKH